MSKWSVLVLVLGAWGCSSESSPPPPSPPGTVQSCLVPSAAKPLVMHAAFGALTDASYIASHASPSDRPYALSVVGSSRSVVGTASAVEPCTDAAMLEPFCTGGGSEPGHEPASAKTGCFRFGCEQKDVALIDVFVPVEGAATPTTRAPFTYSVEQPLGSGTIKCAENPWRTYRVDLRDAENARVEATVGSACTFESETGDVVDLTHRGLITTNGNMVSVTLSFTGLARVPLEISLTHGDGATTGEALIEGRVVMRAREAEGAPPFVWEGECAD